MTNDDSNKEGRRIVVDLNADNWKELTEGKTVFVNFFTSGCSHCQQMSSAWTRLAALYNNDNDNASVLVGDVDCDKHVSFCRAHAIIGTPTLLYGDPSYDGVNLQEYGGDVDYQTLASFAASDGLVPHCSPGLLFACNDPDRKKMNEWMQMTYEELTQLVEESEHTIQSAEQTFDEKMQLLQNKYDDLNREFLVTKSKSIRQIALLKEIANTHDSRQYER